MGEVGLGQLGEAAVRDGRGAQGGAQGQVQEGTRRARQARQGPRQPHARSRKSSTSSSQSLSECKGECQSDKTARIRMPDEVGQPEGDLGRGHQRQRLRAKTDLKAERASSRRSPASPATARPRSRRPTRPKAGRRPPAGIARCVPEVPQDVRGRARQRADPPRPSPDDPPLLRADPAPELGSGWKCGGEVGESSLNRGRGAPRNQLPDQLARLDRERRVPLVACPPVQVEPRDTGGQATSGTRQPTSY